LLHCASFGAIGARRGRPSCALVVYGRPAVSLGRPAHAIDAHLRRSLRRLSLALGPAIHPENFSATSSLPSRCPDGTRWPLARAPSIRPRPVAGFLRRPRVLLSPSGGRAHCSYACAQMLIADPDAGCPADDIGKPARAFSACLHMHLLHALLCLPFSTSQHGLHAPVHAACTCDALIPLPAHAHHVCTHALVLHTRGQDRCVYPA
jgi:hypothetical protein